MDFKQDEITEKLLQEGLPDNFEDFQSRYHQVFKEEASKIVHAPYIVIKWYQIENDAPEVKARHYLVELLNNWEKGNSTYAIVDGQIQPGNTFMTYLKSLTFS